MVYRNEIKHFLSPGDKAAVIASLSRVMRPDPHAGPSGCYRIRSLYFDDLWDTALREKRSGVSRREKFRIRYYNDDFSYIVLEKKMKIDRLCLKYSAVITEEECRRILRGDTGFMRAHPDDLVRELYAKMQYQRLKPRVLVSYIREPYIYAAGNVRVTFDSQIRTTLFHRRFPEEQVYDISATDTPQEMILEVKYDAFLPAVIQDLIQVKGIRQHAFSKYAASRRFG